MTKKLNIAIVGATGIVGEALLQILEQRHFPINNLYLLGSERSAGGMMKFAGNDLPIEDSARFDFSQSDIAFFSAGSHVSKKYVPIAVSENCIVIDNTSCFRYDEDVPLIIPEVNPQKIAGYKKRNIIANPNCSTIQMLVALKPLHDAVGIQRIQVSTYQSVSGSGKKGMTELIEQTKHVLNNESTKATVYPQQIAFNLIPHIDSFQENGYTQEEMKMVWETQKIFQDDTILVNPTAVRVPVLIGHAESISIETKKKLTAKEARKLLSKAEGVVVLDDPKQNHYPTPAIQALGKDDVYVGRIREDISHPHGLNLWVVADNVRKGAALNAIQIAEILLAKYM